MIPSLVAFELRDALGAELVDEILEAPQLRESELRAQRERVAELQRRLDGLDGSVVDDLRSVLDHLIRRSVWIVGGDGWTFVMHPLMGVATLDEDPVSSE